MSECIYILLIRPRKTFVCFWSPYLPYLFYPLTLDISRPNFREKNILHDKYYLDATKRCTTNSGVGALNYLYGFSGHNK